MRMLRKTHALARAREASERQSIRKSIRDMMWRDLPDACGYRSDESTNRIASDFRCCELRSVVTPPPCAPTARTGTGTNPHAQDRWGIDKFEQNQAYTLQNHRAMVGDMTRVNAFATALLYVANGRRVLDVGTGPFCLLSRLALIAGAGSVDCVEHNGWAVEHAIDELWDEQRGYESREMWRASAGLLRYDISLRVHERSGASVALPRATLRLTAPVAAAAPVAVAEVVGSATPERSRELRLFHGFSSAVKLEGTYGLVVHEILGHIASSEGVVAAILDLRTRGLLDADCIFVPRRAVTLFAPTEQMQFTCLERIIHLNENSSDAIKPRTKYQCNRFPPFAALAPSASFESLDFDGNLQARQSNSVEFFTDRDAVFDGFHFYMLVDMDGHIFINTLLDETTWRTTYVKLIAPGLFLTKGSRIHCQTNVELDTAEPFYSIVVSVGSRKNPTEVARYSWSGCS